jgi:dihydrofolate synthase / folylpolyglutamate synthase
MPPLPGIKPQRAAASPMRLADWLAYQEQVHPKAIDLGLERVKAVADRLGLLPPQALTLTVAGTNGKGSSVTLAAGIYQAAGYKVGRYTSPHLLRYNERIAIDGVDASDEALCAAFTAIEAARGDVPLTYFEYGTLAALWLFRKSCCEVQVLEVGLGGRLDAVNIVDTDCALITNIGLDHTDWLGDDRDSISFEKAGIMRSGQPAIYVEPNPPPRLLAHAAEIGAPLLIRGRDFSELHGANQWFWRSDAQQYHALPAPGLAGAMQYANAAGVLAAVETLRERLPVPETAIRAALTNLHLRGRYERRGLVILDVAHNAEAALVLAQNLSADAAAGKPCLVLGMLADKPVEAVCSALLPCVSGVIFVGLPGPRGLSASALAERAATVGMNGITAESAEQGFRLAKVQAAADASILVCGSFLTVAAVARLLDE